MGEWSITLKIAYFSNDQASLTWLIVWQDRSITNQLHIDNYDLIMRITFDTTHAAASSTTSSLTFSLLFTSILF